MSRMMIGLPRTAIQQREMQTINLVQALREKGFVEKAYEKPFRVFELSKDTLVADQRQSIVLINIREGIVIHGEKIFSGNRYGDSIRHVENLLDFLKKDGKNEVNHLHDLKLVLD